MATVKKKKPQRKIKFKRLSKSLLEYFLTGETSDFETFMLSADDEKMKELWNETKEKVFADYVREYPYTRPAAFYLYDAPRASRFKGTPFEISQPEPRKRIDGQTIYEGNVIPHLVKGIPVDDDPALFESEESYLKRHNLLLPNEIKQRYGRIVKTKERYNE